MSNTMPIYLTSAAANEVWGKDALLSFNQDAVTVHAADDQFALVQQAARKLDGQGIRNVSLAGDNWTLETAWAFYQGLRGPKRGFSFMAPTLNEAEQTTLAQRIVATDWVCDTINAPAEELTPYELAIRSANFVQSQAANSTDVSFEIIKGEELLKHGWIGTYTVGRGSNQAPVMLQLDYNPSGDANEPVFACVVGKGITFDSGGYSIKASNFMDSMKADMGGAAIAAGALGFAIAQGLTKRVKLILCCAENMISSTAYKLGDIITYKNGKTVEVMNSDAEGRLVLADGLLYADDFAPTLLIDCATLTGAAKMALGNDYHALFSFDQALANRALAAAEQENEGLWQLPLAEIHRNMLPSSFADLSNAASGQYSPGATTAAAFLSHFINDYQQGWLHFDCSGAYRKTPSEKWAVGGTGMGVKTLARVLLTEAAR